MSRLTDEAPEIVLDFSDLKAKREFITKAGQLQGRWRIRMKPWRRGRSGQQNRYYWGVLICSFGEWARSQGNNITNENCHEILKGLFLKRSTEIPNPNTGELVMIEWLDSTTTRDTQQFSEYIEKCKAWLAEFCGVIVPDPSLCGE